MLFSSVKEKMKFENVYFSVLKRLIPQYEYYEIETSFGNVNIIDVNANKNLPVVVAIHGIRGAGPLFLKNLLALESQCRIIIVDNFEELSLNYSNALNGENFEHGQWVFEILARLDVKDVTLLGISVGAISVLNTLSYDARKIKAAILYSPGGLTVKWGSIKFRWRLKKSIGLNANLVWNEKTKLLVQDLITDSDRISFDYLEYLINRFNFTLPNMVRMDREMASGISTPVYLVVAKNDPLFSSKHILSTAKSIIPNLKRAVVLKGEKHFMGNNQLPGLLHQLIHEISKLKE